LSTKTHTYGKISHVLKIYVAENMWVITPDIDVKIIINIEVATAM